jgi:hypothetical protein
LMMVVRVAVAAVAVISSSNVRGELL